jgi:polyhydroxyalkanoate synthesis regulator phasin
MRLKRKGVLIVALALILALCFGTAAMAATGSFTRIESKWLDLQKLVMRQMVKEGRITQEQADEQLAQMKEHLGASGEDGVYRRMSHRTEMRCGFLGIMVDAWAQLTGGDPTEIIKTCRENGTTVWQLAEEAGRLDEWKQKITELSTEKLDTLVQEGRITKEQKSKILDGLKKKLDSEDFTFGFRGWK